MFKKPHISVCICTFKRPDLLKRLLLKLEEQITEGLFSYSVVVVDNDSLKSARQTVEIQAQKSKISIGYFVEPEQNIALARNKTLENAKGDFLAFIDDDEFPSENWLLKHFSAVNYFQSDGALGPVLPYFKEEPPGWVLRGRIFDRPSHRDGHVLEWENTRTGNALIRKEVFKENSKWFDPAFGSGGEDRDFFRRKIAEGYVFVWCNEARVFETVPPERWKRVILIKRALLRGKMALNAANSKSKSVFYSMVAVVIYTVLLPLFFLRGQHVFMKYLIKNCDHLGKIFAYFGIYWVKETYITGK